MPAAEGGFSAPVNYGAGPGPDSVAVADFNGDGRPDLAVANSTNTVSILLGEGSATFQAAVAYAAGTFPVSVAVADFNGDGHLDLAVANLVSDDVSILLGNGNGTFGAPIGSSVGHLPTSVTVGDFNRDGKPDLAVAISTTGQVAILLGLGNGSFEPAVGYLSGGSPYALAVGDFNGDGKPDLAVANHQLSRDLSILLGNGDGTFQLPVNYETGTDPITSAVAVGDFNGDGKPDLAVAKLNANEVAILLGNGNGTFQSALGIAVGAGPQSLVVGDFDGDGMPDLAVANHDSASLSVLLGQANGIFRMAIDYALGSGPLSVAVADINGDGRPDLVSANPGAPNVSVLINDSSPTVCICKRAINYAAGDQPRSVAAGDFNGDGKADLAAARSSFGVSILLGNGDGTFPAAIDYPSGGQPDSVAVGDFNRDGRSDLAFAITNVKLVSIVLGNGDGTFQPPVGYASGGDSPNFAAVGDFNGDGKADLAVANSGATDDDGNVSIFLGNGNGTLQAAVNYRAGQVPMSVAVGDFNRDGRQDLAVVNYGPQGVSILLGNGDGTLQPAVSYGGRIGATSVAVGDFNGDGKQDLAVAQFPQQASILLGNGDGTFRPAGDYAAGLFPFSVAVSDINGDGKQDLALANNVSDNVSILLGNGDGTFQPPVNFDAGQGPISVALADFNGDGTPDLAVANSNSDNVSVLLNACRFVTTTALASSPNPSYFGLPVTFTAAVASGSGGSGIPTGTATFMDGASELGAGTLVGGTATLTTSSLTGGAHFITAVYGGDGAFAASTSLGLLETVNPPQADLSITKTDGQTTAAVGSPITYTIVASNAGPNPSIGATVTDNVPSGMTGVTWACVGAGGGTCTANGTGSINDTVDLPANATVTYTLSGTVGISASSPLANTASVMAGGVADPNDANNAVTDADTVPFDCDSAMVVVPDGRLTQGSIPASGTLRFGSSLRIGNSYSAEFRGDTGDAPPGVLAAFTADDRCNGNSTLVPGDTSGIEPTGSGGIARVGFTAAGLESFFRAILVNGSGSAIPFSFSLSDTTMYSPAWSTNGSFDTYYALQNTTATDLNGTLTLLDAAGSALSTFALSIPAGQTASTNTSSQFVARGKTGTARLTHDGPPGAIVAEAAIANFAISPPYVQPVKFQAMREAR